ncbi:MAG TPA: GntR family transcriptional regulator [Actinomycetota bacterium]|nr:GntR family transcriptional regulator [Actinomycetota bacterium]
MRIRIDPSSREPASTQMAGAIRAAVERGTLKPAERLPPVRELAAELGLAPNTVAKAYRVLESEGLLEGRGRHGTFVAERLPGRVPRAESRLDEAADAFVRRSRQLGFGAAGARDALERALRRR